MPRPIDMTRVAQLHERELATFRERHPRSAELHARARASLLSGVPMPWMVEWAGPHPVFVDRAQGARFTDVDGNTYVDLCLGDTGAMTGHSPPAVVRTLTERAARGITTMLPGEDSLAVGEELTRRFGLPQWQFALTATDANRFTLRLARAITGRPKVLVFAWSYHGSVDEALVVLDGDGQVASRPGAIGPQVHPSVTTRVVEFNDVAALERELERGDVAVVLTEPALTNIGIVLPEPGFHDALREITRRTGTLLCIDETHTICAGPGGATRAWDLEPDFLTIGKPLASGIPAACYGMTADVAARAESFLGSLPTVDVGGIGGTLAGNALSIAAMRTTLTEVLTDQAFARMIDLGGRWTDGVAGVIAEHDLPWQVQRLGCRAEYWFTPTPPRTGAQAAASDDHTLSAFAHLYALNRGILLTPFHNMALMCPDTSIEDVDLHTEVFASMAHDLVG